MKEKGSWCGETHIQKTVYFLQQLEKVPLDYDFVLYIHGPFSFDLRDELTAMRADGLIALKINPIPYGPSLEVTEYGKEIISRFPKTVGNHKESIEKITNILGDKGVAELERLATALYIIKKIKQDSIDKNPAEWIHELKPHISIEEAETAIEEAEKYMDYKVVDHSN